MKESVARWRANFLTGLAVILPAVISLAIFRWLFGTVSNITDLLFFPLPKTLTHAGGGEGEMYWYWSLLALLVAVALVSLIGRLTRNFLGRKLIRFMDQVLYRVPLLNKIYATVKQVNDAFTASKKTTFRQVVLIQYPREGIFSLAFATSDSFPEAEAKIGKKVMGVFVPTTPNPTSGFLLVMPLDQVIRLDMSVADGIKYVISLGSIVPTYLPFGTPERAPIALATSPNN